MTFPYPEHWNMCQATIIIGATKAMVRSPGYLAYGPVRSADELDGLRRDMDEIDHIFKKCPPRQWGVAAQAAMSVQGGQK